LSKSKTKVKIGDIIAIPIGENKYGFSQLIDGDKLNGCYIVFDIISREYLPIHSIIEKPILFMVFTSAFKIVNGDWKIIGNEKVPECIKIPLFKVDVAHDGLIETMITDFKGNTLRKATEEEVRTLSTMSSYTAVVMENAIMAKFGMTPWKEHYNALLYKDSK